MTETERTRPKRDQLRAFLLQTDAMAPEWAAAFAAVDRAAFLPDRIWPHDDSRGDVVDRRTDPDAWYRWADTNTALTTQWDDSAADSAAPGEVSTSSSSMPSVVASMLGDLDARPGMRVLEIGTGVRHEVARCK